MNAVVAVTKRMAEETNNRDTANEMASVRGGELGGCDMTVYAEEVRTAAHHYTSL
jgi:hypothetical protein